MPGFDRVVKLPDAISYNLGNGFYQSLQNLGGALKRHEDEKLKNDRYDAEQAARQAELDRNYQLKLDELQMRKDANVREEARASANRKEKESKNAALLDALANISKPVSDITDVTRTVDDKDNITGEEYDTDSIDSELSILTKNGTYAPKDVASDKKITGVQKDILSGWNKINSIKDPAKRKVEELKFLEQKSMFFGTDTNRKTTADSILPDPYTASRMSAGALAGTATGGIAGGLAGGAIGYAESKIMPSINRWWDKPGMFSTDLEKAEWEDKHRIEKKDNSDLYSATRKRILALQKQKEENDKTRKEYDAFYGKQAAIAKKYSTPVYAKKTETVPATMSTRQYENKLYNVYTDRINGVISDPGLTQQQKLAKVKVLREQKNSDMAGHVARANVKAAEAKKRREAARKEKTYVGHKVFENNLAIKKEKEIALNKRVIELEGLKNPTEKQLLELKIKREQYKKTKADRIKAEKEAGTYKP
jgi:hypothetical protein